MSACTPGGGVGRRDEDADGEEGKGRGVGSLEQPSEGEDRLRKSAKAAEGLVLLVVWLRTMASVYFYCRFSVSAKMYTVHTMRTVRN